LKVDENYFPHPQEPIHKIFQNGDKVEVTVKDCSREPASYETEWYNQAFGRKRHMMMVSIVYDPKTEIIKNNINSRVFFKAHFQMYPELFEEFKDMNYPDELEYEMDEIIKENGAKQFQWDFELPYGDVTYEYFYTLGDDEEEKKAIDEKDTQGIHVSQSPSDIISAEKQRELDLIEEEEIKKQEKKQKEKHKADMESKKNEALERQEQMLTQQENSLKLDIYWKVMDLTFHQNVEDAGAALNIFSLYYDTISEYFGFYASLQYQFYNLKENEFITLHSFMHFLKLFGIADTKEKIKLYFDQLTTLIIPPLENILNIKNGLNFAQFLEAILRIIDFKAKNSGDSDNEEEYRMLLEQTFQDGTINVKNKSAEDPLLMELYTVKSQQLFHENYGLLGCIFDQKSVTNTDIGFGMSFEDFYSALEEAGMLSLLMLILYLDLAQAEESEEEPKPDEKQKLVKSEIYKILNDIEVFDHKNDDPKHPKLLIYVDFLDALVRVAAHFPFNTEGEGEDYETINEKLYFIIEALDAKFGSFKEGFIKKLEQKDKDIDFPCKMVINDESDDEGEYDEEGEDGEY